jgi:hypothetical protein
MQPTTDHFSATEDDCDTPGPAVHGADISTPTPIQRQRRRLPFESESRDHDHAL